MSFDLNNTIDCIRKFLPHQASLKDFIHHNTLEAFQHEDFFSALQKSKYLFGHQTHLNLQSYQNKFLNGGITVEALEYAINTYGNNCIKHCFDSALWAPLQKPTEPLIGKFREKWQSDYNFDIEHHVQVPLFKLLSSYLDQGVSITTFPKSELGFLNSVLKLNASSKSKLFKSPRIQTLISKPFNASTLLYILLADEQYYQTYIWDLLFSHPGWSGFINVVEHNPQTLFNTVPISLQDVCLVELLLEIDALDQHFGTHWAPLGHQSGCSIIHVEQFNTHFTADVAITIWQNALEWTWYDQLISCLNKTVPVHEPTQSTSAQLIFCIDDRESSLRMHIEQLDTTCETFGTPGFFNIPIYFKPYDSIHLTKLCPAPVTPKHLIIEHQNPKIKSKSFNFHQRPFTLTYGWLFSLSYGFVSLLYLIYDLFFPHEHVSGSIAHKHLSETSELQYEFKNHTYDAKHKSLQLGFKTAEMFHLAFSFLNTMGLKHNFAPLVYIIAHGASSQNNPHYAAYDCGACSGRPGSVNARLMALFLNRKDIRNALLNAGLVISDDTQFVAGLHDTTRDEIVFYDLDHLTPETVKKHLKIKLTINHALQNNAAERSRKFETIALQASLTKKHQHIKKRSVSLFEPRPELNHASNCYCIIGPRKFTKNIFLDRRAFLNSYDPYSDTRGDILTQILKPIGPVCGGINLEYYFSCVDNNKFGAGSKLPHNVVGLFGVSNGIDGDLRTGLPYQMIDLHDPLRLLVVVYQKPEIVSDILNQQPEIHSWYLNQWMHLICIDPFTYATYKYTKNGFVPYFTFTSSQHFIKSDHLVKYNSRTPLPISIITHEN